MIARVLAWVDNQIELRTPNYELAMDNWIYVAVVLLAIVTGVMLGIYR